MPRRTAMRGRDRDNGSRHGMEGALLRSTSGAGWRIAKPFNIRGRAAKRLRLNAPELSG